MAMIKARFQRGAVSPVHVTGVAIAPLMIALALTACPAPALAQSPSFTIGGRSYITPFPQTDRYQVHVIGDGLADGLAGGLTAAFETDGTVKITNSAKSNAGLTRPDPDLLSDVDGFAKQQGMNVAVVMLGLNDMRNMRGLDGQQQRFGTDGWREAYAKEIDKLLKVLKDNNVGVYWVGLPVMQNAKTNEAMGTLNDIFRERTYIAGVRFVDTWNGFIDQTGGFAAYGPDLGGQTKRLREADGTYFTAQGNRKLANYVEVLLRRDLSAAKAERNIPLAGDDEEQTRLIPKPTAQPAPGTAPAAAQNPAPPAAPGAPPAGSQAANTPNGIAQNGEAPSGGPLAPGQPPAGAQQAKAAAAAAAASAPLQVPRQLSFRPGDAPSGETIVGDINAGVTALATVSPLNDISANPEGRRLPLQERPYYKALIKGQALKPKPGRADDFKWPKS